MKNTKPCSSTGVLPELGSCIMDESIKTLQELQMTLLKTLNLTDMKDEVAL
jgi:16S rRNA C967 or C1407 C5-methylase (RsmB/RsmF family)